MSKLFLGLAMLFSAFMLFVGLTATESARPKSMIFWIVIGLTSAYKLFKTPAKA